MILKYFNIRCSAYFALILLNAMCPWELLASAGTFISVVGVYSVFLSLIYGIQICDYFLIRQQRVKLLDLYCPAPSGIYHYVRGVNSRAFTALVVGWALQLPGFVVTVNTSVSVPGHILLRFATGVGNQLHYLLYPVPTISADGRGRVR